MGTWVDFTNRINISDKTSGKSPVEFISYKDITDDFIDKISKLEKIKFVQFNKALPEEAYKRISDLLTARPDITLRIWGLYVTDYLDISFLHEIEHLQHLTIACNIKDNQNKIDFNLIKDLPLKSLSLDVFDLKDYSFIKELPSDIEHLSIMADSMKGSVLFDCEWLLAYKNLTDLWLGKKASKHVTSLGQMKNLKSLYLRGIKLTDFSFLKTINLEKFGLLWNTNNDLHELKDLTGLKEIELWRINKLSNVDFLASLSNLETIILQDLRNLTSLPDLSNLKQLKKIVLNNTGIKENSIAEELRPLLKSY